MWCVVFLPCSEIESGCYEIFQSQFGNPPISPLKFLSCSACWSKKQDAGMLTSNANSSSPTMSHALEQAKGARIGVICKSASSKLSASCLHGYTVSMQKIQGFLFWKSIFAIPPIVAAVAIHTLPWKMRIETCPLSAPCTHESKSIDVYTAIHARGSRKVQ